MGYRLGGIEKNERSGGAGGFEVVFDGNRGAEGVGDVGEGEDLCFFAEKGEEGGVVEGAVVEDGMTLMLAPVRWASICHGTMLEWCSRAEMMISSPALRVGVRMLATRLMPSVVPEVKMISSGRPR